jgi:hypothetical protein
MKDVPISMFSAKYDRIVRLEHNKIYAEKLKHVVV